MAGPRKENDPLNVEGSGYHYRDRVVVNDEGRDVNGIVESIHAGGKKIDVRIDHKGHSNHGRVITYAPNEITARKEEKEKASTAKE
jgi:2,4-dienoyl-CoA reductase-like NADH-dependent reductase (Old Yellow Enzyme family)